MCSPFNVMQFGSLVATDVARWARVIKEAGAKAD